MKAQLTGRKFNTGFATLEILIAFAVIILCIGAVVMVSFGNQSIAVDSQINNEAITRAKKLLEDARANSRFDFNLVTSTSTTETSGGVTFTKELYVTQDPSELFTKKVISTVTWQTAGRTLSTILTTLLTNPDAVGGGDTCSSVLTGNWKNPLKKDYEFGKDLIDDSSSGFPITDIDVNNGRLFVTSYDTNGNNKESFFILDSSDPINMSKDDLIGKIDTVPVSGQHPSLNGVSASDDYAYVASGRTLCSSDSYCGQLQIIDINPLPFQVVKTFKIPSVTGTGFQGVGNRIAYQDGLVYLGLKKAGTGDEFFIIDVSNPAAPFVKDSYNIDHDVNGIYIKNDKVYLATPDPSNHLIILDISDPNNISKWGWYTASPPGPNGKSVMVVGNTVYLGRTFGNTEFYILNASSPGLSSFVGSKDIGTGSKTSINALRIRDYLAFFVTNGKFHIWNIANPNSIFPWTTSGLASDFIDLPGGSGTAADCEANYMFIGSLPSSGKGFISVVTGS